MNLLTFAGGFLLVSVIALGTLRFVRHGDRRLLLVASATLLVLALLVVVGRRVLDYDDLRSAVFTRLEGVAEFLLFLSPVVLAWIARRGAAATGSAALASAVVLPVLLALVAGSFRTGETARACLFVYPFLLLLLRSAPSSALDACLWTAASQTILMQATGAFFW